MRHSRQKKILELIGKFEISKQEDITAMLKEAGFDVTQATVSRDIKDLQLIKALGENGNYKYVEPNNVSSPVSSRFLNIFKETIKSVDVAENLVVIKTLTGCGSAAAEALDNLGFKGIVGTIAGDNTIFVAVESADVIPDLVDQLNTLIK